MSWYANVQERAWEILQLDWVLRPLCWRGDAPIVGPRAIWIKSVVLAWAIAGCFLFYAAVRSGANDNSLDLTIICARFAVLTSLWILLSVVLVFIYFSCDRTPFKVSSAGLLTLGSIAACVVSREVPCHLGLILVLDEVVMTTDKGKDARVMRVVAIVILFVYAFYMALRVHLEEMRRLGEDTWTLYLFEEEEDAAEYPGPAVWVASVLPVVLNYVLVQGYASSAKEESENVTRSVELAHRVAEKLANYDLKAAEELLSSHSLGPSGRRSSSEMTKPFKQLLGNLVSYRAFLPDALFVKEVHVESPEARASPNALLSSAMNGQKANWAVAQSCVSSLREPGYNLSAFRDDVERAFPELGLYAMAGKVRRMSSGRGSGEEFERTMGALYSLYCATRLDMDGREVFSFGVDERGNPLAEPQGEHSEAKKAFWRSMPWCSLRELFVRAELLREEGEELVVNKERMMGFLVLTVIHDIMKNTELLPVVQRQHAPYRGANEGEEISDHDKALAYVMERFPWLLPSYRDLSPAQRAPVLFTQGTMSFNNGWLVQGEAPPGLLFSSFKQVIVQGRASEADVAFYFAHWLTDLAGAEPFSAAPWPGAEKFTTKFPLRVLQAFLDSFSFVDQLACNSEVEVMESYLCSRWNDLGLDFPLADSVPIAAMRIALMAQGFEKEAVDALAHLPSEERSVLEVELARTGCQSQFQLAPEALEGPAAGPAICVYYSPALLQAAGQGGVRAALVLLAAVFRAAREMFPLDAKLATSTVVVQIDQLKVLSPAVAQELAPWLLQRTGRMGAKAVRAVDGENCLSHLELSAMSTSSVLTHEPSEHGGSKAASDEEELVLPATTGANSKIPWIDRVPIKLGSHFGIGMCQAPGSVDLGAL